LVVDLTTVNIIVLVGNMAMSGILVYYYRFRAKIEERQTQIAEEDAEARKCLREFRKYMRSEAEEIPKMSQEEMREFIEHLKYLGEDI
jgi:F0F1-type ATP synthase membrane subunit b/b'